MPVAPLPAPRLQLVQMTGPERTEWSRLEWGRRLAEEKAKKAEEKAMKADEKAMKAKKA